MRWSDRLRRGLVKKRLTIGGDPVTSLTRGTAYAFSPTARGGKPGYTFSIAGAIPPGLSFNTATGAITGTPT